MIEPESKVQQINDFLGGKLNVVRSIDGVDQNLCRQRNKNLHPSEKLQSKSISEEVI